MPASIPRQILLILRAQYQKETKPFTPLTRPRSTPIEMYTQTVRTPIPGPDATKTGTMSASGTVTISIGPQGWGKKWYPQIASIATTSGANDASTCSLYLSAWGQGTTPQNLINGQSYAGGGDSIGLAVPPVYPGHVITAVWSGGKSGDTASLTIYGDQDALWF